MEQERDDRRVSSKGATGFCAAAHERAVITVRLMLLLLILGAALFLFKGPGGKLPAWAGPGADAARHR